ncbi:hypothetical protein COOONC_00538 [Cooperia oncophora]
MSNVTDMSAHGEQGFLLPSENPSSQREEIEATEELIRKLRESAERLSVINSGRHAVFNIMKTITQTRDSFIKNYGVMLSNGYVPPVEELASVNLLNAGLDVYLNFYKMAKMRDLMFVRSIMEMEIPVS